MTNDQPAGNAPSAPADRSTATEIELLRRDLADRFDRIERSLLDLTTNIAALLPEAAPERDEEDGILPVPEPAQTRALAMLLEAGATGIGATALATSLAAEDYPTTRPTVHVWLSRWAAEGRCVRRKRDEDRYPTYVHFAHA